MPKRATKTSFKPGEVGNPTGANGEMPEAYRAKERYIKSLMNAATNDEIETDLRLIRGGDPSPVQFHKLYVSCIANLKIHSPEEKEESKAKIAKLKAETEAINKGLGGNTQAMSEKAKTSFAQAIKDVNDLESIVAVTFDQAAENAKDDEEEEDAK